MHHRGGLRALTEPLDPGPSARRKIMDNRPGRAIYPLFFPRAGGPGSKAVRGWVGEAAWRPVHGTYWYIFLPSLKITIAPAQNAPNHLERKQPPNTQAPQFPNQNITMIYIIEKVYAGLYGFIPCLYAITLCCYFIPGLCHAWLGFIPGRRGDRRLPLVGSVRKSGRLTAGGISAKSPQGPASPDPPVVGSVGSALASALASVAVSSGTSFLIKSVLAVCLMMGGTPCLVNPVLPACFMVADAVALFCFMLALCSTRRS